MDLGPLPPLDYYSSDESSVGSGAGELPPLPTTLAGLALDSFRNGARVSFDTLLVTWLGRHAEGLTDPPLPAGEWDDGSEDGYGGGGGEVVSDGDSVDNGGGDGGGGAPPPPPPPAPSWMNTGGASDSSSSDSEYSSSSEGIPEYFVGAGEELGVELWRIEEMKPVKIDPAPNGTKQPFMKGCGYIVLNTEFAADGAPSGDGFSHSVYYWLGESTSRPECIAAAFESKTLASLMHTSSNREDMDDESDEFKALFWFGFEVVEGGGGTGLKHVERSFVPRLYQIKGDRAPRIKRVRLSWRSLNEGDVFVLDNKDALYQWNGARASMRVKGKALTLTNKIVADERGGKCTIAVIEQADGEKDDPDVRAFWRLLGGEDCHSPIDPADSKADNKAFEKAVKESTKLYRIAEIDDSLDLEEVGHGSLKPNMLDSDYCFIVDSATDVFVWIGRESSELEKNGAMKVAAHFFSSNEDRPEWSSLTRVAEGTESFLFIENFKGWHSVGFEAAESPRIPRQPSRKKMSRFQSVVDVTQMYRHEREDEFSVDDDKGLGKLNMFVFENDREAYILREHLHGHFFSGDVVLCVYEFVSEGKDGYPGMPQCVIYFWEGRDADKRIWLGYCRSNLKSKFDQTGVVPKTVRLKERKETPHFLMLFKGNMVVHRGHAADHIPITAEIVIQVADGDLLYPHASESDIVNTARVTEAAAKANNKLYHIRGFDEFHTTAYEINLSAMMLNSGDAFVLWTVLGDIYVWLGKGANAIEREMAKRVASRLPEVLTGAGGHARVQQIEEGKEPSEFWAGLGGEAAYAKLEVTSTADFAPRLFHCDATTGHCVVTEVFDFTQEDLDEDNLALLDTYGELFIWVGSRFKASRLAQTRQTAQDYIANDPTPREPRMITEVKSGEEPIEFTAHFQGWEVVQAAAWVDPREAILAAQKEADKKKRRAVRDAINHSVCTYNATGPALDVEQTWFNCHTCGLVGDLVGVCMACARTCHVGHQLGDKMRTPFACACGAGSVPSCVKCLTCPPPAS